MILVAGLSSPLTRVGSRTQPLSLIWARVRPLTLGTRGVSTEVEQK